MKFIMFRGLPASGKSTRAQEVANIINASIVERDLIREKLGVIGDNWSPQKEKLVTEHQKNIIISLMQRKEKIISSDTNYNLKCEAMYKNLCKQYGYDFTIIDMMYETTVLECIRRDSQRTGHKRVGESVIREMADRYGIVDKLPDYDTSKPDTIIVDIDGTVAKMVNRTPYDYSKVLDDAPRTHVIKVVRALYFHELKTRNVSVTFMSGRPDSCYKDTEDWIQVQVIQNNIIENRLLMRREGDMRSDSIVKGELFDNHIRDKYNVIAVFDDRPKLIKNLWLPMGAPIFNVGTGEEF